MTRRRRPPGARGPGAWGPWTWFAIFLAVLGLAVLWLASRTGGLPADHAAGARIAQGVGLAALIAAGLIHGRRIGIGRMAGALLFWLALGGLLVLGYSFRYDLERAWQRVAGELVPAAPMATGGDIAFRRAADGHFYAMADVNGTPVRFMIDTGATATVIDPGDAARAGIDVDRLAYTQRFRTANGVVRAAPVMLESLRIGPAVLRDVPASVNAVPIGTSLIGIRTLEKFSGWRVEDGVLTLSVAR